MVGYFYDEAEDKVLECPAEANCEHEGTTTETLDLKRGYFRLNEHSKTIYSCSTKNCLGTNSSACGPGSRGVLCNTCECKEG